MGIEVKSGELISDGAQRLRLAVLMTCHCRREFTMWCLESLFSAVKYAGAGLCCEVFLVDDGSTDGTSAAVRERFPHVTIIAGDGSLYWCGGMRLAWREASAQDFDGYLWLNDDVALDGDALRRLIETMGDRQHAVGHSSIVVGAVRRPGGEAGADPSYGGLGKYGVLPLSQEIRRIELFNGNVVLVPREVFHRLGSLSPAYTHGLADLDYGIRAKQAGVAAWLAPGSVGTCSDNGLPRWQRRDVPLLTRLRELHRPTGCPPYQLARLIWSNGGWWFPWSVLKLYAQAFFPPRTKAE